MSASKSDGLFADGSSTLSITIKASYEAMENGVLQGCECCAVIAAVIPQQPSMPIPKENAVILSGSLSGLRVEVDHILGLKARGDIEVSTRFDDPAAKDIRIMYRDVATNSGDESCLRRIANLVAACNKEHEIYATYPELPRLPTRVLDLGLSNTEEPRLIHTNNTIQDRYVALSHCWGTNENSPLCTTFATLEERCNAIPLKSLTRVFQDAIRLTRFIQVRYIWIDALCIIQDSKEDWALEASRMASIYQNAYLTVASACSPNSNTAFLRARDPRPSCSFPIRNGKFEGQGLISLRAPIHINAERHMKEPLQLRAWTFQERLLSRRTLFFDSDQFLFECSAGRIPESRAGFEDLDTLQFGSRNMATYKKLPEQEQRKLLNEDEMANSSQTNSSQLGDRWYSLLVEYTLRTLTYGHDTLPALSGVAKMWTEISVDVYLAGLWKADIHRGLLWRSGHYSGECGVARSPFAPSWSWASIHNNQSSDRVLVPSIIVAASAQRVPTDYDAVLLDHEIVPVHNDPMGQLAVGRLSFLGWVRDIVVSLKRGSETAEILDATYTLTEPVCGLSVSVILDPDLHIWERLRTTTTTSAADPETSQLTLQGLFIGEWVVHYHSSVYTLHGILLIPSTQYPNEYLRAGVFEIAAPMDEEAARKGVDYRFRPANFKANFRKLTFDGTWAGWEQKMVTLV